MWHHAVKRRNMSFLFCLSFANRASDSGDLYIDFNRIHLTFPVAYLVCQDYALFIFSFRSMHMHCIPHLAYHAMFMWWLFTLLFASFRCCFFGLVPISLRL